MAKKSKSSKKRKQRKPNIPTYAVPTEESSPAPVEAVAQPQSVTSSPILSAPIAGKNATTDSVDWSKEYPYFAPDMKRLGYTVALMVLLLLALNLIFIYVL